MEKLKFIDVATYDGSLRTAVSVRDGVLEYLGSEIGQEPPDKIFTVYRSPATIASLVSQMPGIPVIGEHIEPGTEPANIPSRVESASFIDAFDESTNSTLAIQNKLFLDDAMLAEIEGGKHELSLGYEGRLIPHDKWDFEQRDLVPTHLATVDSGRCGSGCRFIDRKPNPEANRPMKKLHKAFCDADGSLSLSQIVELAAGLPEAIKNVPADKLAELLPALQEIMAAATEAGVETPAAEAVVEELPVMTDEDADKLMDESAEAAGGEPVKVTDSARKVLRKKFADKLALAISGAVKVHASVIDKARTILPETYSFADKSTAQLMRDALAVEHGSQKFSDSELSVAFKLLKKSGGEYQTFGDSKADETSLSARLKKSLES